MVEIGNFAASGVAEALIGDLRTGACGTCVSLGQAAFGVYHGRTVHRGCVVDKILAWRGGGVGSGGVGYAQLPVKSVVTETGCVACGVRTLDQIP